MVATDWSEYPIPTLMRSARGAYAQAIRTELHAIGVGDLPRNGAFVLIGVADSDGTRVDLPHELGVTKQAISQVVEVLVRRGFLERNPDTEDRRRVALHVTARGLEVLDATQRACDAVDHKLAGRVSGQQIEGLRSSLAALSEIKADGLASGAGWRRARASRQLRQFSPIFPVRNLAASLAHYDSLGFKTSDYDGGNDYGFADRDGIGLHLERSDYDARQPGSAYLYVRDADALFEEWSRPGVGGETRPVRPTAYALREGSHVDPDGNLIRFGSPIGE
jgi:DNA-binding MarR family transcriptional regulator/catechol 2,3-dioxygenase-like lactoylglutathione lyase family enzyme